MTRAYPPVFVDKDTLAYLLNCELSDIEDLLAKQVLPRPTKIGDLERWHWPSIDNMIVQHERDRLEDPNLPPLGGDWRDDISF
jgi:hypothetical protein